MDAKAGTRSVTRRGAAVAAAAIAAVAGLSGCAARAGAS